MANTTIQKTTYSANIWIKFLTVSFCFRQYRKIKSNPATQIDAAAIWMLLKNDSSNVVGNSDGWPIKLLQIIKISTHVKSNHECLNKKNNPISVPTK